MEENKELTLDDMKQLTDFIDSEAQKHMIEEETKRCQEINDEVLSHITSGEGERDLLLDKLKELSLAEVNRKINSHNKKAFIDNLFTNQDGDELVIDIDFDTPEKELDFKCGLVTMLKTSQEAMEKIDEEQRKLDEATIEINRDIQQACKELSDNVLAFISLKREEYNNCPDEKIKAKGLETLRYIESAYTMDIYKDIVDRYPSTIDNCIRELKHEESVKKIGKRYTDKLKRNNVKISLIQYASDISIGTKSFEEIMLIKDDQYTIPDLFVFSLIRYFAMADWNNVNIRKAHASICLNIKKLFNNEFDDAVKADIIDAIVDYLDRFK